MPLAYMRVNTVLTQSSCAVHLSGRQNGCYIQNASMRREILTSGQNKDGLNSNMHARLNGDQTNESIRPSKLEIVKGSERQGALQKVSKKTHENLNYTYHTQFSNHI